MDARVSPDRIFHRWGVGSGQRVAEGDHVLLAHGAARSDDLYISIGPFEVGQGASIPVVSVEDAFCVSNANAITAAAIFS
jgi:hypothetical protein